MKVKSPRLVTFIANAESLVTRIAEKANISLSPVNIKRVSTVVIVIGAIVAFYVLQAVFAVVLLAVVPNDTITIVGSNGSTTTLSTQKTVVNETKSISKSQGSSSDVIDALCRKFGYVPSSEKTGNYEISRNKYAQAGTCEIRKIPQDAITGRWGEMETEIFTDLINLTEFAKSIGVE